MCAAMFLAILIFGGHWFLSLKKAKRKIDEWRQYYNEMRPPYFFGTSFEAYHLRASTRSLARAIAL